MAKIDCRFAADIAACAEQDVDTRPVLPDAQVHESLGRDRSLEAMLRVMVIGGLGLAAAIVTVNVVFR